MRFVVTENNRWSGHRGAPVASWLRGNAPRRSGMD
jgi:hypothetical protein